MMMIADKQIVRRNEQVKALTVSLAIAQRMLRLSKINPIMQNVAVAQEAMKRRKCSILFSFCFT